MKLIILKTSLSPPAVDWLNFEEKNNDKAAFNHNVLNLCNRSALL
jgi:hypothetical protein